MICGSQRALTYIYFLYFRNHFYIKYLRRCLRNIRNRNATQTRRKNVRNCTCRRTPRNSLRNCPWRKIIRRNHKIHTQGIHNTENFLTKVKFDLYKKRKNRRNKNTKDNFYRPKYEV